MSLPIPLGKLALMARWRHRKVKPQGAVITVPFGVDSCVLILAD